jgi:DNA-binding MarR family transcriptional regulator
MVVSSEPHARPEEMSLLFDVWLLMHLASGMLDDALEGSDLSSDDFGLYSLLRVFGPATPTQIARWTGMRPTTVSAALRRMSGRGHSEQQPNPADGRSYLVALNTAGSADHLRAAGPFLEVMAQVSAALQPDEDAERIVLQRLDSAMRATTGLDPRPYRLGARDNQRALQLPYTGDPLTPTQESTVRAYIDFVRTQPVRSH